MSSLQCFVYGGLTCLAGTVVLGIFLGIIILAPLGTQLEQTKMAAAPVLPGNETQALSELESTISQPSIEDSQNENGFYGTLLSREGGVLMVKELDPSLPLEKKSGTDGMKTFVVRVSENTGYTYQRPRNENDVAAPLFSPEEGKIDSLKEGMFVFVATRDDVTTAETVTASYILYSEKSPFAQ
jgi:hypothetical protein